MPRTLLLAAAAAILLAVTPAGASAQARTGIGSSLTAEANYPVHCDWRWVAGYGNNPGGFGPGGSQEFVPQYIGPSTCSLWQSGVVGRLETSHLVPGTGTVTVARVKAGANPAPVSIATVRMFEGRDGNGGLSRTCCRGVSETPTVNLTPNAVTEIPVNFRVETKEFDPNSGQAGYHDIVVVNVHGSTGTLPLHNLPQPKPFGTSPAGDPNAYFFFPQIDPSVNNQNSWIANGFEVLMNYDWCPGTAAAARAAQACAAQGTPTPPPTPPAGGGGTQTPTDPTPPAPGVALAGTKLRLKGSAVGVRVRCTAAARCTGKATLRTRAKRAVTLGSGRVSVAAGKTGTVAIKVAAKHRKRVTARGIKAQVVVDLGAAGTLVRDVTVKRGR